MNTSEKRTLTALNKIPAFQNVVEKISLSIVLTEEQKAFILSCAILFLRHYQKDRRLTSYSEFAYYIILKYSTEYNDYTPLYDFSASFGFYPITKAILDMELLPEQGFNDCFLGIELEQFKSENHIETLHQHISKRSLLIDQSLEKSFIAPTSFGKSSIIADCIRQFTEKDLKICIIVPTKSLLMQTYRMVKEARLGRKIIIHDEMYQDQSSFIAVFTQERALRLLSKNNIYFDLIFIDEAHNILKQDSRAILLSRLLAKNRLLNPSNKVIYLSPLVDESDNLRVENIQSITQHKIPFNIKEPEIFEYRLDGKVMKYNRFVNEFYFSGTSKGLFSYIRQNSKQKNFLYNLRPALIERLARQLSEQLENLTSNVEITNLVRILKQEVHEQFFAADYIQKGVVYLHGKLPDLIKEYLESKFRQISELKYIIANQVILEGINLPIDNLFILNTRMLRAKELTNLIGRVNRLNTIFKADGHDLAKLLPSVHFVNSEEYNRRESNMSNKIVLLRSRTFKDYVENPTLSAYNLDDLGLSGIQKEIKAQTNSKIVEAEEFLKVIPQDDKQKLKQYLIENGIALFYGNIDDAVDKMIEHLIDNDSNWAQLTMLQKISNFFIRDMENIRDYEFARLSNVQAQNYYEHHITVNQRRSLKENIVYLFRYFNLRALSNPLFYFGETYGEVEFPGRENSGSKSWVDLSTKTPAELINLAVVKLKMEDDFISFKLNKFIIMMHDYQLISNDEYNLYIYGTIDQRKIDLTKFGLNINLISRLEKDGQLHNIYFDEYNNLSSRPEFDNYKNSINDFYRFEIERFLSNSKD